MSLLQSLDNAPAYLKAGFLGFNKSGKTYTSTLLAIVVRTVMKNEGNIAFYDTETGSDYVKDCVKRLTGKPLLGIRSRSFDDLLCLGDECVAGGVSCLIVDSVTHLWRGLCESYLSGLNESRRRNAERDGRTFRPKTALEFQDWGPIKAEWAKWTSFYLSSPLNIIICGRAGYEYDMEVNDETHKKELVKTGTKMKTESEFGFEPSLLVEMECVEGKDENGARRQYRTALVKGDRFRLLDGKVAKFYTHTGNEEADLNDVANFFMPHLSLLRPQEFSKLQTEVTPMDIDENGNSDWVREKKTREILCEEIQGVITVAHPGQTAEAKKTKAEILQQFFGTRSWTAVESMHSDKLRPALANLKAHLNVQ